MDLADRTYVRIGIPTVSRERYLTTRARHHVRMHVLVPGPVHIHTAHPDPPVSGMVRYYTICMYCTTPVPVLNFVPYSHVYELATVFLVRR